MRTTPEECAELGRILAEKVNAYSAPVTVLLPTRAISIISAEGQPFHDPEADAALFSAMPRNLPGSSLSSPKSGRRSPGVSTAGL